jgi:polysaccharide export outer membrane protein
MKFSSWRLGALAVLIAATLAACSTTQQSSSSSVNAFAGSTATVQPAANVIADSSLDYRVGPRDILEITVYQVPDLSKTVEVSGSGQIALPLIGAVAAGGKTVNQLQTEIASKLGAKYLQSPQVTIFVKESKSQQVTVEGAVSKPGIYPTTGQTTLLQVITLAGGLTDVADGRGVVILRSVNGGKQAAKFDYGSIRNGSAIDPLVQGGDVVVVDQSGLKAAWRGLRESIPVFGLFAPFL